jgi:hypothetical protein
MNDLILKSGARAKPESLLESIKGLCDSRSGGDRAGRCLTIVTFEIIDPSPFKVR